MDDCMEGLKEGWRYGKKEGWMMVLNVGMKDRTNDGWIDG